MKIISIIEKSTILPQVLSLTPLVKEYEAFWKQLTTYSNQKNSDIPNIEMEPDEDLIDALVYASYQIPRLLFLAHSIWYNLRKGGAKDNRLFYIEAFELEAINYYGEMVMVLNQYSANDIAHIILSCGVHWQVDDENGNVPGTDIPWVSLIQKSLIFPYLDNCFIFPFALVWRVATKLGASDKKREIETKCAELVPNLDVKNLFISYDALCSWENYNLGVGYETLFVSSLAVKYYLRTLSRGKSGYFSFPKVYDIDPSDHTAYNIMDKYEVDFSKGISLPADEVFTDTSNLDSAIVHNKRIRTAHHDMILPARTSSGRVNIAVQAKASSELSDGEAIERQLLVRPNSQDKVEQLFWLYLGEKPREKLYTSIVFLSGIRCCNGLALDIIILVKKLKSKNQNALLNQ